jgi:hypothetical protein
VLLLLLLLLLYDFCLEFKRMHAAAAMCVTHCIAQLTTGSAVASMQSVF